MAKIVARSYFCSSLLIFGQLIAGGLAILESEHVLLGADETKKYKENSEEIVENFFKNANKLKTQLATAISKQKVVFKRLGNLDGMEVAERELREFNLRGKLPSCVSTDEYRKTISLCYEKG